MSEIDSARWKGAQVGRFQFIEALCRHSLKSARGMIWQARAYFAGWTFAACGAAYFGLSYFAAIFGMMAGMLVPMVFFRAPGSMNGSEKG